MTAYQIFNAGLDSLADWESATYVHMLMQTGSFDASDATVAAVLGGGSEITVVGYGRDTATSTVRTVVDASNRITYACDDPDFGTMASGETVTALVTYLFVTNDADSIPIGWCELPATDTGAFDPFTIALEDGIAFYTTDGG